jgi:hypothetical protein
MIPVPAAGAAGARGDDMSKTSPLRLGSMLAATPFVLTAFLAACGSGAVTSTSGPAPAGSPAEHLGHGFTALSGSGSKYNVYLTRVVDPAHGSDSFITPHRGDRFVAAVFTIKGVSKDTSDDANSDAILIGSDGQAFTADFDSIKGYTNFDGGDFTVGPGVVRVGAVAFQVPDDIKVTEVQWSAAGSFRGQPGTWRIRQ